MRCPATLVAVPMLAGAAAAAACPGAPPGPLVVCLPVAWGAACLAWRRGRPRAFVAAVVAASCLAGAALAADAARRARRPPLLAALEARRDVIGGQEPVRLEGRLRRDAQVVDEGARLDLDVARVEAGGWTAGTSGAVRLSVRGSLSPRLAGAWRAGRRVRLWALVRAPGVFRNLGDPAVPPPPSAALVGAVKSARLVEVLSAGSWLDETAARARAFARRAVTRHVGRRSRRAAAIITAILIGDRGGLDDDVRRRLQEAGTYHVIAISGAHVALLAALLLGALRVAGVAWRLSSLTTIAALSAYAYVVGDAPSVARATVVAAVYLAARVLDHRDPTDEHAGGGRRRPARRAAARRGRRGLRARRSAPRSASCSGWRVSWRRRARGSAAAAPRGRSFRWPAWARRPSAPRSRSCRSRRVSSRA